jgi:hypothetical protein
MGELLAEFCWGDPRKRDHLKDPGIDGIITLNLLLKN